MCYPVSEEQGSVVTAFLIVPSLIDLFLRDAWAGPGIFAWLRCDLGLWLLFLDFIEFGFGFGDGTLGGCFAGDFGRLGFAVFFTFGFRGGGFGGWYGE